MYAMSIENRAVFTKLNLSVTVGVTLIFVSFITLLRA